MTTPQDEYPKYVTLDKALKISASAAAAVRLEFNPSSLIEVDRLKKLMAAYITLLEEIRDDRNHMSRQGLFPAAQEASVAITHARTTSMWAVLAATNGL